jgi:EAL domain-containing protein (putative c-di-GMP-specific phosphodiesterase class I)
LKVVAEGVENAQTMELLRTFQCDEAQGYYLCRPVTADMATRFLLEHQAAVSDQQTMIAESWQPANPPH